MVKERTTEAEIGGYITSLLRENFGKGPTSVYVTLKPPFFTVHLRGFIAPMEQVLLKQEETQRILETRDLLMEELKQEMREELWRVAELDVKEIYADWNLENKSGVIIGIMDEETYPIEGEDWAWPEEMNKEVIYEKIDQASEDAEKRPEKTEIYWLNDRVILIRRTGILVRIEKELIKNGVIEDLKLAKRPLERNILREIGLEPALQRKVYDYFVDWNFDTDKGFIVLNLEPEKK